MILVLAGIIFYPKFKPMFRSGDGGGPKPGMRAMGGGQPLFASGYVLVPTKMDELIYSTGSLLPDEEVDLAFETSGKVVGLYFEEGRKVKKGELMAKINDRPLQAQLLKLQAQQKLVQKREYRQRQLLDRDAISRESYDQVATELQTIEADLMLIESQITEPLEQSINGIPGIRTLTSSSSQGRSRITVEFELSVDLETAANDVRDKVSQAQRYLPATAIR